MNPICSCSLEIQDTSHYLLLCHHFYYQQIDLMSSVKSIRDNFESMSDNNKTDTILNVDSRSDENKKGLF